jgi:hypothetical protein
MKSKRTWVLAGLVGIAGLALLHVACGPDNLATPSAMPPVPSGAGPGGPTQAGPGNPTQAGPGTGQAGPGTGGSGGAGTPGEAGPGTGGCSNPPCSTPPGGGVGTPRPTPTTPPDTSTPTPTGTATPGAPCPFTTRTFTNTTPVTRSPPGAPTIQSVIQPTGLENCLATAIRVNFKLTGTSNQVLLASQSSDVALIDPTVRTAAVTGTGMGTTCTAPASVTFRANGGTEFTNAATFPYDGIFLPYGGPTRDNKFDRLFPSDLTRPWSVITFGGFSIDCWTLEFDLTNKP